MDEGVSVLLKDCNEILQSSAVKTPSTAITTTTTTTTVVVGAEVTEATVISESEIEGNEKLSNVSINKIDYLLLDNKLLTMTTEERINVKKNTTRSVRFPSNDNELVTGYLEPANPWEYAHNVKVDDVITLYKKSCDHHCTEPLKNVIGQLEKMNLTQARVGELCLKNENLDKDHCEPLEEILKRIQFYKIDLEAASLNDESAETLFDMFEYYESARHINISNNCNMGARGWESCAQMLKGTRCLEQLDAKDIVLTQQHMNILKRPLQLISHLQILKLENCNLAGKAFVILISALKLNTGLKELYLANNHLEEADGTQLGSLLRVNHYLQLLDVSNNNLANMGAQDILTSLIVQSNDTPSGKGLSILIMWNNQLTKELSGHFAEVMAQSKSLETLNIGKNLMSDEFLEICKDSLKKNNYLLQLGLQSTGLILKSVMALAEIIEFNVTLQRIDLRGNNIQLTPLTFLSLALKKNTMITQIDLDDKPGNSKSQALIEQYGELIGEIRGYCQRNDEPESIESTTEESTSSPQQRSRLSSCSSRKISLTCQTLPRTSPPTMATTASGGIMANELYGKATIINETKRISGGRLRSPAPSPIPSPVASPIPSPSRSRFVVSRVSEQTLNNSNNSSTSSSPTLLSPTCFFPTSNGVSNSRFRVTIVEPSPPPPPPPPTPTISVSLPVTNIVTASSNTNVTVGFNCIEERINTPLEIIKTDDNCELTVNKSSTSNDNSELNNVKLTKLTSEQAPPQQSQNYTSSLEKLLGLFQHPGNLFATGFVDKIENKNPLHSSMSSLIGLGDKFHQYLRNDSKLNEQKQRLTSSESQLCCDTKQDKTRELINKKSLIDNINTANDNNLSINCLNSNSTVPELLNHDDDDHDDNKSTLIDKTSEIIIVNNDKQINNSLNDVNEICDSSSKNCSINSSYSNDNNSHKNKQINILVNNVDDDDDDDEIIDNVNSKIINNDKLIDNSIDDINCENLQDNVELLLPNYSINDEINCETFDDDINNILTSILDMIPAFESTSDSVQSDKKSTNYSDSDTIVNIKIQPMIDNNNIGLINCQNSEMNFHGVDDDNDDRNIIQRINCDDSEINNIDSTLESLEINNDKRIDKNNYSYSWINIKSSDSCEMPIDNSDFHVELEQIQSDEINQLNNTIVNLISNDYLDSGDVFNDELITNIRDIALNDGPISSDLSLFEHNSETSSNVDTLSENPSSSRDSFQESIDSGIDDTLLKDKRNIETKITINIPIINDNDYLSKDKQKIDQIIITQNIDEIKLPMEIKQIADDNNTNSSGFK